jgi:hypothetical protein
MIRYRPDPKNPRQLTREEQQRLDKARIDYSDIPELGDEFFPNAEASRIAEALEITAPEQASAAELQQWVSSHTISRLTFDTFVISGISTIPRDEPR